MYILLFYYDFIVLTPEMENKVFAGFGLPNDVTKDTIDDALIQAVKFGNNKNVQRITITTCLCVGLRVRS